MTIKYDAHKLSPTALIDLYSVDLNSIGVGQVFYFYPGSDEFSDPIQFQGNTYSPWFIDVTGIDKRGTGSSPRPSAVIGNLNGVVTDLCRTYQDMVGAIVRRRRTLGAYVIGNIAEYRDEYYLIERRAEETNETVKFELASPMDFLDKMLPGIVAIANGCPHRYKSTANGSGCSWPGTDPTKWFNSLGQSVGNSALDVCGKRLSDCKLRFGVSAQLDFGGNPGLGRSS